MLAAALREAGHEVVLLAPEPARRGLSLARRLAFNIQVRGGALESAAGAAAIIGFDMDGVFVRPRGVFRVVSIKGELAEEARFERGSARLRLTIESRFEKWSARHADRVVATSLHSKERIREDYGVAEERIRVVPEPIDLARWDRALSLAVHAAPAAGSVRAPGEPASILCVAHLYPRKDVATLLEAVARLPAGVVLRVVGTGPERGRLEERARSLGISARVELAGHVPFDRLAAEYRRADVFCLPSRQEGFGIVFLEAMAAGLPIVAARAAAVPELVREGETGALVPPGDAPALAAALRTLLQDPAERRRLGEGGRRRVLDYDAPIVARRFLDAIDVTPTTGAAEPAPDVGRPTSDVRLNRKPFPPLQRTTMTRSRFGPCTP